jgi:hypothetical protein
MKMNDLTSNNVAVKALRANFDYNFDPSNLSYGQTLSMMTKINGLIKEARMMPNYYKAQNDSSYMKLVFMSQALLEHFKTLKPSRILVENAEVEKSQVILAAQDMVDQLQKMLEETNNMLVKELPALTDSIQSEIGANESQTFNQAASEALTTLNQCLSQSKQTLQSAMNAMTGQGDMSALGAPVDGGEEIAVTDIGAQAEPEGEVIGAETVAAEVPDEEPEIAPVGGVGREKR